MTISPRLLKTLMVTSFVTGLVIILATQPWTLSLGHSWSPQRIAIHYACVTIGYTIPALITCYLFAQKPEWLAPSGKYIAGYKYKALSTYALVAAAIVAAVYAVGGLLTGVNIDLPALIAGFSATYFGSIITFMALFFGFFIRWAIGGAPWLPMPILALSVALLDASTWALNSYIFWSIIRSPSYEKRSRTIRTALLVLVIVIMIVIWNFGTIVWFALVGNPLNAFLGYIILAYSTWIPTGMAFIVLGTIIGHSMYIARVAPRG